MSKAVSLCVVIRCCRHLLRCHHRHRRKVTYKATIFHGMQEKSQTNCGQVDKKRHNNVQYESLLEI